MQNFNNLTPGEMERLGMLAEAAACVINAALPIITNSTDGLSGDPLENNLVRLKRSMRNLLCVCRIMSIDLSKSCERDPDTFDARIEEHRMGSSIDPVIDHCTQIIQTVALTLQSGFSHVSQGSPIKISNRDRITGLIMKTQVCAFSFGVTGDLSDLIAKKLKNTHHQEGLST